MAISLFKDVVAKKSSHFKEGVHICNLTDMVEIHAGQKVEVEKSKLKIIDKPDYKGFTDHDQLALLFMSEDAKSYAIKYINSKGFVKAENEVVDKDHEIKDGYILDKKTNMRIIDKKKTEQAAKIFADVLGRILENSKEDSIRGLENMLKEGRTNPKKYPKCGLRIARDYDQEFLYVKNILSYTFAKEEIEAIESSLDVETIPSGAEEDEF